MTMDLFAAWEARSAEKAGKKGLQKGRKEGRAERSLEIALNLLREATDIEKVARATGLSLTRVRKPARELAVVGNPAESPS